MPKATAIAPADGAGRPQPRHGDGVARCRSVAREVDGAGGRDLALLVEEILDRHEKAGQRPGEARRVPVQRLGLGDDAPGVEAGEDLAGHILVEIQDPADGLGRAIGGTEGQAPGGAAQGRKLVHGHFLV
mgnify:CR=1 FL=1